MLVYVFFLWGFAVILVVGGQKGGTGKTTIATNLAAMRARAGRDVLLIDTDTQASASSWAQIRGEEGVQPAITCIAKFGLGVADEVRRLAPKFDDVILDAGGRDSVELRQAMLVSHVMLIPARPSQFDLHGLAAVDRLVGDVRALNNRLVAMVVVNCAPTHATNTDADDMREVVADMANLKLTDAILKDRIVFRRAARDGRCVAEFITPTDEKACWETMRLYKEVFAQEDRP